MKLPHWWLSERREQRTDEEEEETALFLPMIHIITEKDWFYVISVKKTETKVIFSENSPVSCHWTLRQVQVLFGGRAFISCMTSLLWDLTALAAQTKHREVNAFVKMRKNTNCWGSIHHFSCLGVFVWGPSSCTGHHSLCQPIEPYDKRYEVWHTDQEQCPDFCHQFSCCHLNHSNATNRLKFECVYGFLKKKFLRIPALWDVADTTGPNVVTWNYS